MILKIGRRVKQDVASLEEAQRIYCMVRDESREGASSFPDGTVVDGKVKYRISYNGRVWLGAAAHGVTA